MLIPHAVKSGPRDRDWPADRPVKVFRHDVDNVRIRYRGSKERQVQKETVSEKVKR